MTGGALSYAFGRASAGEDGGMLPVLDAGAAARGGGRGVGRTAGRGTGSLLLTALMVGLR